MTIMSQDTRILDLEGYPFAYREAGEGPAVLLVHGMISDHGLWDVHLPHLIQSFHVLAPALRHFGVSPWPDKGESFSMDQQAADLGDFIEALDLGPVDFVGWSLGGALGLILAAKRPHLIKSMLLYEPSLAAGVTSPDDLARVTEDRRAMFAAAKTKFEANEPRDAIEAFVDGANDLAGTFHRFPEAMQQVFHRNVRVLAPFFTGPPPPQITPGDFEAISNQTTLVLGEESRRFWQIAVPAIARRIPSAKLLRLPGRRHMWPAEAPEDFSSFVADLLGSAIKT